MINSDWQVDEEGAEAAAATAMLVLRGGGGNPIPVFRVDHPFVVILVGDNNVPVFIGHVTDPEVNWFREADIFV